MTHLEHLGLTEKSVSVEMKGQGMKDMSDYEYYDIETGEGLHESDLRERYDDLLAEIYGTVIIAGCEFDTSWALKNLDPIAYRCGFLDWVDSEIGDTISEEPTEN